MSIDKILNSTIKALLVFIICIMLTIGALFVIPPNYAYALGNGDFTLSYSSVALSANSQYSGITVCHFDNSRYGNTYIKGTENSSLPVYGFRNNYAFYVVLTSQYSNYHGSGYELTNTGKTGTNSLTFSSTYYDDKFSYNSTYDLYYYKMEGFYNGADSFYVDSCSLNDGFSGIRDYIDNLTPSGDFLSLPQDSYTSTFDFDTIKTFGAWVYSGYNIYSLYGAYSSVVSPTSQYCYIDNGNNTYSCAVFSSVPLTVYVAFVNGETYTYYVCSQYDVGKYYYVFNQNVDISGLTVQPFDSLESAQSAFSGSSSGGGAGSASGVVSAGALSIDVPAGNVLYVRVRPGSLASVTATIPVISSTSSPYWLSSQINTQWASGVSSPPNENTHFPISGMSVINFLPDDSKGLDGYGRSYYARARHAPFNSGYFVVYNPTYTNTPVSGRTDLMTVNPTVTVNCQYALSYEIYELSETLTVDGGTSSNTSGYTNPWSGEYDPEDDVWDDTSQRTDTPQSGGEQSDVANQNNMSIGDYLTQIWTVLNDFVSNLGALLTAPIAHIQALISAGTAFMSNLANLFVWLPQPVVSIISSCLIVALVIGVLKLLF